MTRNKPWLLMDVDGVLNILAKIPTEDLAKRNMTQIYIAADTVTRPFTYHGEVTNEAYEKFREDFSNWRNTGEGDIPNPRVFAITWRNDMGAMLRQLQGHFRLAWATTWEGGANQELSKHFGLPEDLPVIEFKETNSLTWGLYPKTPIIAEWAAGEPFLWFDDQAGPRDQAAIEALYERVFGGDCPQMVYTIDPYSGITPKDVEWAIAWAEKLNN